MKAYFLAFNKLNFVSQEESVLLAYFSQNSCLFTYCSFLSVSFFLVLFLCLSWVCVCVTNVEWWQSFLSWQRNVRHGSKNEKKNHQFVDTNHILYLVAFKQCSTTKINLLWIRVWGEARRRRRRNKTYFLEVFFTAIPVFGVASYRPPPSSFYL